MKRLPNPPAGRLMPARILLFLALACLLAASAWPGPEFRAPDAGLRKVPLLVRGESSLDKLDPELRTLYEQYTASRRQAEGRSYTAEQLFFLFGIDENDRQPLVKVRIDLGDGMAAGDLKAAGVAIHAVDGKHVLATVVVQGIGKVAQMKGVVAIRSIKAVRNPAQPQRVEPKLSKGRSALRGMEKWDTRGMTGKGVIVGVVDTGIDFRHGDFLKPDGTTRILYLWDMVDGSYGETDGAIGDVAPIGIDYEGTGVIYHFGTLYDADAINAALRGNDTCRSIDIVGHGTACASTAAGNGMGTGASVPAGTYKGVAPEADLIIVRAGDGSFDNAYVTGVQWIMETARSLGRPCVVNLSLGGHYSAHDGHEPEEEFLNSLIGPEHPGAVICVSAGNEGRESFHSSVRYGPMVAGQADATSSALEIYVKEPTELHAYFGVEDEWGLAIMGQDQFLVSDEGNMEVSYIQKVNGVTDVLVPTAIPMENLIDWARSIQFSSEGSASERVAVPLPPGRYYAWTYGASEKVSGGKCDLYLPFTFQATFGSGTVKEAMVGTPGNADEVITVGSYDFQVSWPNMEGGTTRYNMVEGGVSDYSSPGFRRDGAIKPDIVGPGRFMISAAAQGASMTLNAGNSHTTPDGKHIAWEGTSASTPYVAGVVALMLQKNPRLTAPQVKEILIRSASSDRQTGRVPNPAWGNGKINPAAALKATP